MRLLGIDVPDELRRRWRDQLAPERQPFFLRPEDGFSCLETTTAHELTDDLRCTYTAWRIRERTSIAWLTEESFMALPRPDRARLVRLQFERRRGAVPSVRRWQTSFDHQRLRAQADGLRFVWWPSLLGENPDPVIRDRVEDGQLASRHDEVSEETWRRGQECVPGAREIVGRFPRASGPNCFGATLSAAGHAEVGARVLQEPFDAFLTDRCVPGGRDKDPRTVLVWRGRDGQPAHSAITIGDGWGVEKPAETWWTPTIVADVADLVRINRAVGLKLERHRLAPP